jgi:hypothetical protein
MSEEERKDSTHIDTGGGIYIGGGVRIEGGDFVAGDKYQEISTSGSARREGVPAGSGVDADEYDLATIRRLLLATFTSDTLRRFCQERKAFRPITADFSPRQGLNDMIDSVLDYCRTQVLFGELLAEIREYSPRQYERFERQLREGGDSEE